MPRSCLFARPPRWFGSGPGLGRPIPPAAADWLREEGSLTRRLRAWCGTGFRVRLLHQEWDKPFPEEALALGLAAGRRALVREVALQCRERPLVLARSVIPASTLHGVDRRLAHLGTRPLGEILFADPRLRRSRLDFARPAPAFWQAEWRSRTGGADIFGRRSRYTLGRGHSLLVAEFFLPELLATATAP